MRVEPLGSRWLASASDVGVSEKKVSGMTTMPKAPVTTPSWSEIPETGRPRHHWWRWIAGVLVVLLVLFGAGAWYFSGRIESGALASTPAGYIPVYDDVQVTAVTGTSVTLAKGPDVAGNFEAPGVYGLAWQGGTGHVGSAAVNADGTVTRPFALVSGTAPTVGQLAAFDHSYWFGDPTVALGIPKTDVSIGGNPAWYFPAATGDESTVAIFVHGRNGNLMDGLRFVQVAHGIDLPVLDITYRNDVGAEADPSGRLQFGQTEWQDLQAAVAWVQDRGARHVVLAGQSMGAAVVAAFLEKSEQRSAISGVVFDAPMLSLDAVVTYGARDALPGGLAVPSPLIWGAEVVAGWRYGVDWAAVNYLDDTSWLTVPTLVFQGAEDQTVPVSVAQDLASQKPTLVTLDVVPQAMHIESWNVDRDGYAARVAGLVTRIR